MGEALETIDEQAAADRIERGPQRGGELEILIAMSWSGLDLKEQSDHSNPLRCEKLGEITFNPCSGEGRLKGG
jgi:hypothetical protein